MKKSLLLSVLCFYFFSLSAQLNISYVGDLPYSEELSDIWGYAAPDGTEYAIVGVYNGTSLVSLADPANPVEVGFIPGAQSIWRDIKTYGDFAFVTTDQGSDGLLVIDMTNLPTSFESYYWKPQLLNQGTLNTCHNIYIDEDGWMYLAGCNLNNGAVMIFDVFTDSYNPVFVNNIQGSYAHDVFTKGNNMYSSNLTNGLQIFDVSDKMDIQLGGVQTTAFNFTHNAWSTDDNNFVFTTDELANAPVGAYDVSNLNDIKEMDQFRPTTTLGEGVIPHNAHVWNDFVIVSYYSDGCIILDATHPDNLIEVGNFDTFIPSNTGFNGAWGAYPYLPSGLILVSDISSGLYVLQPNYVQGCYLEGLVTDANTSASISGVEITIDAPAPNIDYSDNAGEYKTGQAIPGTFEVTFTKTNYYPLTTSAVFENGVITILDVQMIPFVSLDMIGNTIKTADGTSLADVAVVAQSSNGTIYSTTSNGDGTFTLENIFEGDYQFFAGKWGYFHAVEVLTINPTTNSVTLSLSEGYQDDFFFDFDWEINNSAQTGIWELGEPIGTSTQGNQSNPDFDVDGDLGVECYVTGNGGGGVGNDDIDGGITQLISPPMDLTTYNQPIVKYRTWFFNVEGNPNPNDDYIISVSNGSDEVILETITESASEWRPESSFILSDFIDITDNMTMIYSAQDQPAGHLVEAALDAFIVEEGMPSSTANLEANGIEFQIYPNPFDENTVIELDFDNQFDQAQLSVFNVLGQLVQTINIEDYANKIEVGQNWNAGIYLISLEVDGKTLQSLKLVKQ
ncbi:MAG: choice-of-anchor B family protein [Saprospiraceae bacterium]